VFLGDYLGTQVAVKQINSDMVGEDNIQKYLLREEAITQYSHPHLVQVSYRPSPLCLSLPLSASYQSQQVE
jgi:hypothetical protein